MDFKIFNLLAFNFTIKENNSLHELFFQFSLSDIGTKVSSSISTTMTMFIAFTNGWKMTLVVLAGLPIIGYAQSIQNIDPDEEDKTNEEKKRNEEENNGVCVVLETLKNFDIRVREEKDCIQINKRSVLRRQSRDTNRNIKRLVYCQYE